MSPSRRTRFTLPSILILCACGESVAPAPLDAALDDRGADAPAQPDASAPGVAAIFVSDTATVALDAQRRAYAWGFFATNNDPAQVYRRPYREPALDRALSVRSLYATVTCGLIAEDGANVVRCAVIGRPYAELPWARGARAIAFSPQDLRLWALMPDGFIRRSQPLQFDALSRAPIVRLDGFVDGLSDARTLACSGAACCATTARGELVCWGDDPALPRPATIAPQAARSIGRATRVAHSVSSATRCAQRENEPLFCWGLGARYAFGFAAPDAMDPRSRCIVEGAVSPIECVQYPGASFEGVFIDSADGVGSTALVLRTPDRSIVVEGPTRPWLSALDPQPVATHAGAMGAPVVLRGLRPTVPFAISGGHACWADGDRVRCVGSNAQGQLGVDRRATPESATPVEVRLVP